MACVTCGNGMKPNEKTIIHHFKEIYQLKGVVRWIYVDNGVKVTRNYKNIPKGKEYFHIKEWNG